MMPDEAELKQDEYEPTPYADGLLGSFELSETPEDSELFDQTPEEEEDEYETTS
jgi:hypothetical protein